MPIYSTWANNDNVFDPRRNRDIEEAIQEREDAQNAVNAAFFRGRRTEPAISDE